MGDNKSTASEDTSWNIVLPSWQECVLRLRAVDLLIEAGEQTAS